MFFLGLVLFLVMYSTLDHFIYGKSRSIIWFNTIIIIYGTHVLEKENKLRKKYTKNISK